VIEELKNQPTIFTNKLRLCFGVAVLLAECVRGGVLGSEMENINCETNIIKEIMLFDYLCK
jgi:hypothetical protein